MCRHVLPAAQGDLKQRFRVARSGASPPCRCAVWLCKSICRRDLSSTSQYSRCPYETPHVDRRGVIRRIVDRQVDFGDLAAVPAAAWSSPLPSMGTMITRRARCSLSRYCWSTSVAGSMASSTRRSRHSTEPNSTSCSTRHQRACSAGRRRPNSERFARGLARLPREVG